MVSLLLVNQSSSARGTSPIGQSAMRGIRSFCEAYAAVACFHYYLPVEAPVTLPVIGGRGGRGGAGAQCDPDTLRLSSALAGSTRSPLFAVSSNKQRTQTSLMCRRVPGCAVGVGVYRSAWSASVRERAGRAVPVPSWMSHMLPEERVGVKPNF